jgi:hypothetical protein
LIFIVIRLKLSTGLFKETHMPASPDKSMVGKFYLYLLPFILLSIVLNLVFNEEARSYVGLKPGKALSLGSLFGRQGGARSPVAAPVQPLTFSADEVRAFTDGFTKREVRVCVTPPPPPLPVAPQTNSRPEAAQVSAPPMGTPWPVRVQATFKNLQGNWTVIIASQYFRAKQTFESDQPNRCAYAVLAVGRKCVWLQAYPLKGEEPPALPDVEWPDVLFIDSGRNGQVPVSVRLANGVSAKKGDTLMYEDTQVRFTVKELWSTGVFFEAIKDDKEALIACMLVNP